MTTKFPRPRPVMHSIELAFSALERIGATVDRSGLTPTVTVPAKYLAVLRAVRLAALLERDGALLADIDRYGRVVGWHVSGELLAESARKGVQHALARTV